jgi:N-acetylmuramoyl-L-alanine amidase
MAAQPGPPERPPFPLRPGEEGEAVADLQRRLDAAGFATGDTDGVFGQRTTEALKQFQTQRGLPVDDQCDATTWAALIEAGYGLGDRVLYLSHPMLRGDDVAELQRRLGGLGFDAGRVDGIFGPDTDRAVREFQRNAGLTVDGLAGPATLDHFDRLGARIDRPEAVAGVREREQLRDDTAGLQDRRVMVAHTGGLDALTRSLARHLATTGADVVVVQHPDPSTIAQQANDYRAHLLMVLELGDPPCWSAYYGTTDYESAGGRRLAGLVAEQLAALGLDTSPTRRMRIPVLRESRMPAVTVHLGPPGHMVTEAATITAACGQAVANWVHQPLDPGA